MRHRLAFQESMLTQNAEDIFMIQANTASREQSGNFLTPGYLQSASRKHWVSMVLVGKYVNQNAVLFHQDLPLTIEVTVQKQKYVNH